MGANDNRRRKKAMLKIDQKMEEYKSKYGSRAAAVMKPEILEEVSEETDYAYKTLERYHNDWIQKRGIFACE